MNKEKCDCSWCSTDKNQDELNDIANSWAIEALYLIVKRKYPERSKKTHYNLAFIFAQLCDIQSDEEYELVATKIVNDVQNKLKLRPGVLFIDMSRLFNLAMIVYKTIGTDSRILGAPIINGLLTPDAFVATLLDNEPYPLEVMALVDKTNEMIQENINSDMADAMHEAFSRRNVQKKPAVLH